MKFLNNKKKKYHQLYNTKIIVFQTVSENEKHLSYYLFSIFCPENYFKILIILIN